MKKRIDKIHARMGVFNCILHNDSWFNNYMFKYILVPLHQSEENGSRVSN